MTFSSIWLSASWVDGVTSGLRASLLTNGFMFASWSLGKALSIKKPKTGIFRASSSFPQWDYLVFVYRWLRYKLLSSSYYCPAVSSMNGSFAHPADFSGWWSWRAARQVPRHAACHGAEDISAGRHRRGCLGQAGDKSNGSSQSRNDLLWCVISPGSFPHFLFAYLPWPHPSTRPHAQSSQNAPCPFSIPRLVHILFPHLCGIPHSLPAKHRSGSVPTLPPFPFYTHTVQALITHLPTRVTVRYVHLWFVS